MQRDGEKLCLGTVQFGQCYGIKNERHRQPTQEECFAILDAAQARGIRYLDTASVYGTSEDVLGAYVRARASTSFRICSKLRPDDTVRSAEEETAFVVAEARLSLERLGLPLLYGYLLHRAADLARPGVRDGLLAVRRLGLAEHIGVSVYEPEEAARVVSDDALDLIQIPYNALDQRLDRSGFFDRVRERKKNGHPFEVFARSAFLQGLLLMDLQRLPRTVAEAQPFVERFQAIAARHGFTPAEAAMLYALTHEGIDHVVFGVDTEAQLAANLAVAAKAGAFAACASDLRGAFDDVPREVVVPSLWHAREAVVAIVQARTSSSRLPRKVLRPILGTPMILQELARLKRCRTLDRIVLATSVDASDDELAAAVQAAGYMVYRGSLDDVLDRYARCAALYGAAHVVRITGDCPIIDPAVVDRVVTAHLAHSNDYTSNTLGRVTYPDGLDTEVMTAAALRRADREARLASEREHVTQYLIKHPELFQQECVENAEDLSAERWTVDEPEDFAFITRIFEALYPAHPAFGMADVLAYLAAHPVCRRMNAGFERNEGLAKSLREDRIVKEREQD